MLHNVESHNPRGLYCLHDLCNMLWTARHACRGLEGTRGRACGDFLYCCSAWHAQPGGCPGYLVVLPLQLNGLLQLRPPRPLQSLLFQFWIICCGICSKCCSNCVSILGSGILAGCSSSNASTRLGFWRRGPAPRTMQDRRPAVLLEAVMQLCCPGLHFSLLKPPQH